MGLFILVFEHFLTPVSTKYSWCILNIYCFSLRISHFSILLIKSGITNRFGCQMCSLLQECHRFSQITEQGNIYVYSWPVYVHISKVFFYIPVHIHIHLNVSSYSCLYPLHLFSREKVVENDKIVSLNVWYNSPVKPYEHDAWEGGLNYWFKLKRQGCSGYFSFCEKYSTIVLLMSTESVVITSLLFLIFIIRAFSLFIPVYLD